jgi:hypothetical protein
MPQVSKLNFQRAVGEFAQWRAIRESERSLAPGWWWQPAFEVRELQEVMMPLWGHCLELPLLSSYAAGAAVLMATLADQTSQPWPDEFPRKIEHERKSRGKRIAYGESSDTQEGAYRQLGRL